MESHEGIGMLVIKFSADRLCIHILRYRVIDIKQCYGILTYAGSDKLAECSVDINLTGNRDSASCQTAVYIAGNKSKLCLECRPAFSSDGNIFAVALVVLYPV